MKWNWFGFVYSLAKGDPTKFNSILQLNFLFSLTFKSFEKDNKNVEQYYNGQR